MFRFRFEPAEVDSSTIQQLRGMEGRRVKFTYERLGVEYGVTWKGRDYSTANWNLADGVNCALSATNASLYALTSAVCLSMGFIPQLGFVHDSGTLLFIYDIADLYKHETSWPAAFRAVKQDSKDNGTLARQFLKERVEQTKTLKRMAQLLSTLFDQL
jgi:CRISPR-associated protein Cas1